MLTSEQYHVLREKGTDAPYMGKYYLHHEKGVYTCAGCGAELFTSDMKFDSECGWPSFDKELAGNKILKIDPQTRAVASDLYDGAARYYSAEMGSHQYQPNGNVLITVPGEGRVLLVSPHGDPIMEFNNVSTQSREFIEHVENSAWFPPGYFTQPPECAKTS